MIEQIRLLDMGTQDGMKFWAPAVPFTVNGISYDIATRGKCHLAPMISLKYLNDEDSGEYEDWDSPHVSSVAVFTVRTKLPEWQDLTWDPDIVF